MTNFSATAGAVTLAFALSIGAANAGTVLWEGGGPGIEPGSPAFDQNLGDFPSAGGPTITITGDTGLYGGVTKLNTTQYKDSWKFDFGSKFYDVVFNWKNARPSSGNVDGSLTVSGTLYSLGNLTTVDVGRLTGVVSFLVDPIAGEIEGREWAYWDVQVAAVPLPAGAVLMLTGLGALALKRRKAS